MRVKIAVEGIVQGVGFRPFVFRIAARNKLHGYVKNKGDAGVEIVADGSKQSIDSFLCALKEEKPPKAHIYGIRTRQIKSKEGYRAFTIERSTDKTEQSGSITPPDMAICDSCLEELGNSDDPRHSYFFITCTECGPRFTIIEKLPYDRENTTMRDFPMCSFCQMEYDDPANRRFHAQTVACPKCGPKACLKTRTGNVVECEDPIREAGKLISEGKILVIKGYGGFHVAASVLKDRPLERLREVKYRSQKPFAIMARDLPTIETFADVSLEEAKVLESSARPIVLLNKNKSYCLSETVAPDLHNIGVMLPYTALHKMLFDKVDDPAFLMTSANPPNQPIVKDDEEALKTLGPIVDYFLLNDRQIAHRCDDSVVRVHGSHKILIRRSRGYAPAPIVINEKTKQCAVGLGGELNNTSCVLHENKAFVSQHIGDVENIETKQFLKDATKHLIEMTNCKPEVIACDLHPKFATTRLAHEMADEYDWRLVRVQHHHAHVAGLMAEHSVGEVVGICCDGYGYGQNGEAWGGEILYCSRESAGFDRLGHLEEQPLLGGDLATRYPLRVAAAILSKHEDIADWVLQHKTSFPHGEKEAQIFLSQLAKRQGIIGTTSCGRILDAVAAILSVCYERTYEGEPAMKLESIAIKGRDALKLRPLMKNGVLQTTELLWEIFEKRSSFPKSDLAYSAHKYLAEGLAHLAIEGAQKKEAEIVGFSGGAACNEILASLIRKTIERAGLTFLAHKAVPTGDGGISFGQTVVAGLLQT